MTEDDENIPYPKGRQDAPMQWASRFAFSISILDIRKVVKDHIKWDATGLKETPKEGSSEEEYVNRYHATLCDIMSDMNSSETQLSLKFSENYVTELMQSAKSLGLIYEEKTLFDHLYIKETANRLFDFMDKSKQSDSPGRP